MSDINQCIRGVVRFERVAPSQATRSNSFDVCLLLPGAQSSVQLFRVLRRRPRYFPDRTIGRREQIQQSGRLEAIRRCSGSG
jgi:hypothetical protein